MSRGRRSRAVLILLGIGVAALSGCGRHPVEAIESETPVSVKTESAVVGSIRGAVRATGIVDPAPGAELVVVAPEAARILEIARAAGEPVRRGDVLVQFEIPSSVAELQRQEAEVVRAGAAVENAAAAQTRARDLFDRGVAARRDVEDSVRAMADAEAALTQARASLVGAQSVAGRSTVRATFDGFIIKRYHNPGDLVEATSADPVLRIVDPRRLEVVAAVPFADASRITVGAVARIVDGSTGTPEIALRVLTRPAAVEAGTATIPVRLGFAAPVTLPVGAPVEVAIDAEQHQDVVLIPAIAIVREGDQTAVFVASAGKAHRRSVRLGLVGGTQVEVVSGVAAGEAVIVEGQSGLPDEAAIALSSVKNEGQ